MPFDMGGLGDMLGNMFLPNTYGAGAGPPSHQGAPNPMTPPLWRPQNNLDDPLRPQSFNERYYDGTRAALPQPQLEREPLPNVQLQRPALPNVQLERMPLPQPPQLERAPLPQPPPLQRAPLPNVQLERPALPNVAPSLPMTPPGGGIQGMINHPFVQSILADPRKMQAAMSTPAAQSMLQDPRAMAYLSQMLQGR